MSKTITLILVLVLMVIVSFGLFALLNNHPVLAQGGGISAGIHALQGSAWSSNLGWIEFNPRFGGVFVNGTTGILSGYAWADPFDTVAPSNNIGWLSFNSSDYSSCGAAAPTINLSTGAVSGWAKFISADNNDWDGCVHLSGTGYSSSVNLANNQFTSGSYFWGGPSVAGWIHLCGSGYCVSVSNATTSLPTAPGTPSGLNQTNTGCDSYGGTVVLSWNAGNPPPSSGGGYYIYRNGSTNPLFSYTTTFADSGLVAGQNYTYQVSAFNSGAGQVAESGKTSSISATASTRCANSTPVTLYCVPPTVLIGNTATLKWTVTNSNSCTLTGTNGDPQSGGSLKNPFNPNAATSTQFTTSRLKQSTDYTLTCGAFSSKVTCGVTPTYTEF